MPAPRSRPAAVPDPEIEDDATIPESPSAGAASSTASSAGTEFFEPDGEGPEFEGAEPADQERAAFTVRPGEEQILDVDWDPKVVRSLLESTGQVLHTAAGKSQEDWVFTERELRAIAPPLARILSRYPVTAAASGIGDEFAVIIGFSGYTMRSLKERKAAIEAQQARAAAAVAAPAPAPDPNQSFDPMAEAV